MTYLILLLGLALLVLGAEALVRGASRIAAAAGISPLVIGLTIVACGTSTPEVVVSVTSSLGGQGDIALGNVVGSNIFNVLFILGLSAVITPLAVSRQLIRLDVPLMIGVSVLAGVLALDGLIGFADGLICVTGFGAYTWLLLRQSRKEHVEEKDEFAVEYGVSQAGRRPWLVNLVLVLGGLGLLVLGGRLLVDGAVAIARALGVGELVIGLTIIAAGTSLPEVATSVLASVRGERDIAVGNVVGSNIFNILGVMGLSALVAREGVPVSDALLGFDVPVMIAAAIACLPVFFTGHIIARWEGGLFLAYYAAYTTYLLLASTGHAALPTFTSSMVWFALPLTAVTLVVVTVRAARGRGPGP